MQASKERRYANSGCWAAQSWVEGVVYALRGALSADAGCSSAPGAAVCWRARRIRRRMKPSLRNSRAPPSANFYVQGKSVCCLYCHMVVCAMHVLSLP